VPSFPYDVPTEGQYSYLPRLLGRAKVTFAIRRKTTMLGNITIVADGFAAPITAGTFVDLSIRNFYTGLPVKLTRKKVGSGSEFEVATMPILGSFQEGFYDPLTAKLRRIPLEIIRVDKTLLSAPKLSYAEDGTGTTGPPWDFSDTPASVSNERNGKSLLSFDIPGLVALNHPDKNLNGGSSEFFSLQDDSLPEDKRSLLDGEYAPFGYIVEGYDLYRNLFPGDTIESTYVDDLGQLNLVKLRQSSFSEVVHSSEQSCAEAPKKAETTNAAIEN
jgi:peptidylprolyl isomerase